MRRRWLAERVRARRAERCGTVERAASLAGISHRAWVRIEAGHRIRPAQVRVVEIVLGWRAGSCDRVLDGGEPIEIPPGETSGS